MASAQGGLLDNVPDGAVNTRCLEELNDGVKHTLAGPSPRHVPLALVRLCPRHPLSLGRLKSRGHYSQAVTPPNSKNHTICDLIKRLCLSGTLSLSLITHNSGQCRHQYLYWGKCGKIRTRLGFFIVRIFPQEWMLEERPFWCFGVCLCVSK